MVSLASLLLKEIKKTTQMINRCRTNMIIFYLLKMMIREDVPGKMKREQHLE